MPTLLWHAASGGGRLIWTGSEPAKDAGRQRFAASATLVSTAYPRKLVPMKDWSRVLRAVWARPTNTPAANAKTRPNTSGDVNGLSQEAIETLPAAIYKTDAEGHITFYNEAAATLWGCRPELGDSKFCGSWKLY